MRAAAIAAAALAAMAAFVGCARAPRQPMARPVAEVSPTDRTIVGALDLVVGDPATGNGAEQISASVVEQNGRRTMLVLVRKQLDDLGPGARAPGTRVRVTGQAAMVNGAPTLRVTSIALVTP